MLVPNKAMKTLCYRLVLSSPQHFSSSTKPELTSALNAIIGKKQCVTDYAALINLFWMSV